MIDYKELNSLLAAVHADACAADCHGFLCGRLCVNDMPASDVWIEYLDVRTDDGALIEDCNENLNEIVSETIHLFESTDLEFHPLLPDDKEPLEERVSALSEWCHGFLNGFAMGKDVDRTLEDDDGRELIENFTRICQLEVEEDHDESDEKALFELVEYVRMGVIFMYTQMNTGEQGPGPGQVYH